MASRSYMRQLKVLHPVITFSVLQRQLEDLDVLVVMLILWHIELKVLVFVVFLEQIYLADILLNMTFPVLLHQEHLELWVFSNQAL